RGLGILGLLQELQEPLRLADLTSHPRSVGFPPNHPPMRTFLGVPIRHEGESLGNLYLTEKANGAEFAPEDETLLVLLAAQAALAIRNARRHQEVAQQRAQAEAERRRLQTVVESSPAGLLLVDAVSREVALVNREAERIVRVSYRTGMRIEEYLDQIPVTY